MSYFSKIDSLKDCLNITFTEDLRLCLEKIAFSIVQLVKQGGIILTAGNGGSHSQAEHLVGELAWRLDYKRQLEIPAVCLTSNPTVNSALANDLSYEEAVMSYALTFTKLNVPIIFIGFSTSGKSSNILEVLGSLDAKIKILFTGQKDRIKIPKDINCFYIDSWKDVVLPTDTIQEVHLVYIHILCDMISKLLR